MGKYSSSGRKHTNCKIVRSSAAKQEDVKLINNCISSNINNHEINRRGKFGEDEEGLIIRLHSLLGNRWSLIAGRLPGRTAGEVKNHWESHIISKAKNLTIITCACCNKKPQHHPPHINISNHNIINKSSSSSASREDHRRPIRKLWEYYHALDPTAPDDDDDDDDGGEIDLSLKIGLPFSTASSHRFIRTVAEEEKKKMMMMMEEVIARDVEAAQINDYETPALLLFR